MDSVKTGTPSPLCLPKNNDPEILRVIAVGSVQVVTQHVHRMYQLGYAQPHEWSKPLPTVNPNEIMRILTKRLFSNG
ncbi:MAG: hypothetical protein VKK04_02660 [Synechococcales bacterium]|nr:hypothetical protein [Synechococcales bacterium]